VIDIAQNPIKMFQTWMASAEKSEPSYANSMSLATVDEAGTPSVRIVLLKGVDDRGFVFYTNSESRKGIELQQMPKAALCFHWKTTERQVRVEGSIEQVSPEEADAYFVSRPRMSRIGTWASLQSRPLESRKDLQDRVAEYDAKYPGEDIPRPPHWVGYRVVPHCIEFWDEGDFRLHDRLIYTKQGGNWMTHREYP